MDCGWQHLHRGFAALDQFVDGRWNIKFHRGMVGVFVEETQERLFQVFQERQGEAPHVHGSGFISAQGDWGLGIFPVFRALGCAENFGHFLDGREKSIRRCWQTPRATLPFSESVCDKVNPTWPDEAGVCPVPLVKRSLIFGRNHDP
jgi:hypothetical protein